MRILVRRYTARIVSGMLIVFSEWDASSYAEGRAKAEQLYCVVKSKVLSNNAFNRSGISLLIIRQLEGLIQYFPPG